MGLQEQIATDLVTAMKAKDKVRVDTLRMVKAAMKTQQVEPGREASQPLDDAAAVAVLMKLMKQRKESIEVFSQNNRQDLADKELGELAIIEEYLPAAVTPEEIEQAVAEAIAEVGATSAKQMGQVMSKVLPRFAGRPVDGKVVSAVVKAKLG